MPAWEMTLMQDPSNLSSIYMTWTYNVIMEVMVSVTTFIVTAMSSMAQNNLCSRLFTKNNLMEILWTMVPMMALIYMASPSLQLLYLLEEDTTPAMTVKAIGHQWYWSYEYPDFKKNFDSYMTTDTKMNKFRLLDVDNRLMLPFGHFIRILCSSTDVIHSWTVPSMGLKMDALPGRINQMSVSPSTMGTYFGQCSEICGTNHSFMPIVVEVISTELFIKWVNTPN